MPAVENRTGGRPRHASRSHLHWNRWQVTLLVIALVVVIGAVVAVVVVHSNPSRKHAAVPPVAPNRCPLTDLPAPGGKVPRRPALLVKIGNEPEGARPQSGLNEADIVYDTPAEGFIMRYVAVYQCDNASSIGPTRSVRWVDYHMIAPEFGKSILAFAGGINPNLDAVASDKAWLSEANLLESPADAAGIRITSRVPPDNLYTSTAGLYGLFKNETTAPSPIFAFSDAPSKDARPAASIGINFSAGTDVVWDWDAREGIWLHTYSGAPDIDALTNQQVSTTNIVVEVVHYQIGPYVESQGGSGDIESNLLGTGPGYVLRNGTSVKVTWHCSNVLDGPTFTDDSGKPVDLAPGRTWVEIVPNVQADAPGGITITP
jgi:hypothetical protein